MVRSTDDDLPDHLFQWLEATSRRLRQEVMERAQPGQVLVRGSQGRLLQLIPPDGMRVTDLAERAHMTKQALGQLVDVLERKGLVTSEKHPDDARVRIVKRTPAGDRACAEVKRVIADAEAALRNRLGPERFDEMKSALRDLGREAG